MAQLPVLIKNYSKKYSYKEQEKYVKKIGLYKRHSMILTCSDYVASTYPGKGEKMKNIDNF